MPLLRASGAFAALALFAPLAQANFVCGGTLAYMGINSDGFVYVQLSGFGVWAICSIEYNTSMGGTGVNATTCRGWYAALLAARKTGSSVALYFTSTASGYNVPECSALGTWVFPNPLPYHMDIRE